MSDGHFDFLIIGGGQAGIPLAHALADDGHRVALAERRHLGGSCVNFGCTPTKAVLASARVAHLARRATDFGLHIPTVEVDFGGVLGRARKLVMESRTGLESKFDGTDNPALLRGDARFEGYHGNGFRLRVGEEKITAGQVVLNVGTRSLIPDIEGLDAVDFLDAGNWLDGSDLPSHLVVIGGGYIGLEMGQFYRRMGSRVTVVQSDAQLLPREDKDVAEALQTLLEKEGIRFLLNARAKRVAPGSPLKITLATEDGDEVIEGCHLFLATGRTPNTDDLGLETIGLETTEKGFLEVDERLATKVADVWAAGDVRGGPMFTHSAWDDFRILRSQFTGDGTRTTDRIVPYAVFTDPELGRVGMTEEQARQAGKKIRVERFEMKRDGKAREMGETDGFIKVLIDQDTNDLLGAAVLAVEGSELVHTYATLMNAGAPYTTLRDAVQIHPTLNEAVQSVLL